MHSIHRAGRKRPATVRRAWPPLAPALAPLLALPFALPLAPLLVPLFLAPAQAQASEAPLSLAEAVQIATTQSRRIAAAQHQTQAAREMAAAAAQRPDPVLKLGVNNLPIDGTDRLSLTADFMTMRSVAVMQELTHADKRAARAARAEREVDAAIVAQRQALAQLQRDTALAWLERSSRQQLRELLLAQMREAELQVQAAQALVASGKASVADVLAARGQLEQVRDSVAMAERDIAVAGAQLARWVGAAAQRVNDTRPALDLPHWAASTELETHLAQHPQIEAAVRQEALALADIGVAQAEREADWSVELMFSQRGPAYSNMVSLNVSVPLQWRREQRQDRELASRHAMAARSAAERDDMERAHLAEVRAMLEEWRSHEARLKRFDANLLPLAEQRSAAALAAYRGGGGNLAGVLEARRAEIDLRIERTRIETELARLWAQLTYLIPNPDTTRSAP
jgi:outer membrane protein TolC